MRWFVLISIACACGGSYKSPAYQQPSVITPPSTSTANGEVISEHVEAMEAAPPSKVAGFLSLFQGNGGPSGPATATPIQPNEAAPAEQLVVEMWMDMQIDDVAKAVAAVSERVVAGGGRG